MGLADKMAAARPPPGAMPQQQHQYGQPSAQPGQPYSAYPGGPPQQPGQYTNPHAAPPAPGQPPSQPPYPAGPPTGNYGQPQYGAPPPGGGLQGRPPPGIPATNPPQEVAAYRAALERAIEEKNLRRFYPPGSPALEAIAQSAPAKIATLCQSWRIPLEVGRDLARLGLYDIILYIDDSGSMQFEERGQRIDDLKTIIDYVAQASTLFDHDGIDVRFMNSQLLSGVGDNITNKGQIEQMISSVKFAGLTPLGTELRRKVVDGMVLRLARSNALKKPVLVIAVTDGQPAQDGPDNNAVFDTVRYAVSEVQRATGTTGGIAFQFAQVGNDAKAREFLGKLDTDPSVGPMVDCTSNFENEQEEMMRQNPSTVLTPELWLVKLLMGAIDPSYDASDETTSHRPGGAGGPPPQQSGYNRPPAPQPQYGQQPPQYGNAGGYGQPSQYGAPGGYGAPPGYPPQGQPYGPSGGYGAPPPPPRY